jgi:hypothetical protein
MNTVFLNVIKFNICKSGRFLIALLLFSFQSLLADGTRQVSPGNGSGTATANGTAYFVSPESASGSYPGSPVGTKMIITVQNHTVENVYAGFMARTFNNSLTTVVSNAYIRITNPSGAVVFQQLIPNTTGTGFISNYSQAWNGPNIGGSNNNGYTPFSYDPTVNGDYIVELYRATNNGNTPVVTGSNADVTFPYFDISVATGSGTSAIVSTGRLWSRKWSFITTNITNTNFPNVINSSFEGDFYVYTNDGFKARVDFESGFRPFGFELVMNFEGISSTSDFAADSRSRIGNFTPPNTVSYPNIPNGYRVFLTVPENVAFPNGTVGSPAISGNIYGCPGAFFIPYYLDRTGDVAITLDLNGIPGYQPQTADVVLQRYDVPVGNNVMIWNGLNGLGQVVTEGFSVTVSVLLLQGRVNLPMNDAELNSNGLSAIALFPALGNRPLFWDDTALTVTGSAGNNNSNITTGGTRTPNLRSGILGPSHAWDGSNPNLTVPAPVSGQGSSTLATLEDDFGNGRIINTWFYGSESSSVPRMLTLPGCDNDGDGVSNNLDLDDDNDGILDTAEIGALTDPLGDHDSDSVPNYIDPQAPGFVDVNFDGVDDRYDLDLDGIINQFDTDSDGDGCPDAIEGSENVTYFMVNPMTSAVAPGAIRVLGNGTAIAANQAAVVSTATAGQGVPLVVNNSAGNNTGSAGAVDNTDGTSDVGQGVGTALNRLQQDLECRCYRPANSPGTGGIPTNHGITALSRAGVSNGNWPMKITGAYTVLDAKTNGFVVNRLNTAQISGIVAVKGMMVYDTDANCLKIFDGTIWSCFTRQTCDQF